MKIKSFVLILLLASSVCAVQGGRCDGNVLVYYNINDTTVKRDCSILHSGSGAVFRGVCQTYVGGADCWRAEGTVTPAYRDAVRAYGNNSGWLESYNFSAISVAVAASSVTTTTLVCPICSVCQDCSINKIQMDNMNYSLEQCNINLRALSALNSNMYSVESYNSLSASKDADIKDRQGVVLKCQASLAESNSKNSLYTTVAFVCILLLFVVVVVWIKFEWIGDPKVKDAFGVVSKRKI
jgi:hypothetical protein